MTLGLAERQLSLGDPVDEFCEGRLDDGTVFGLLHRERDRLFGDEMFADLFTGRGRRSVPPSVVACVLVLKQLGGLSDVEAIDRFTFDARWRYACGVGGWQPGALVEFDRTVLVRFRMRLHASGDPDRVLRRTTEVAAEAGLVGVKRVLDSAPLFDAVATMDTVTLVRSAIRGLLKAADATLAGELREVLSGDDDYLAAGKPACDWDDQEARTALIDRLARDGLALLSRLEGHQLPTVVVEAAELLATVIGQDLEEGAGGTFGIVRRVAPDRVISTVDPDARHGRKSTSGKFDGYKGHIAVDPDSEIVTGAAAGPANTADGHMTDRLTRDLDPTDTGSGDDGPEAPGDAEPTKAVDDGLVDDDEIASNDEDVADTTGGPAVYGDAAYGSGEVLAGLDRRNIDARVKTQPPVARNGKFSKDDFVVDLDADSVTCPAGQTAPIVRAVDGSGVARFARRCQTCPLRDQCTDAARGRNVNVHRHEALLARQRARGSDPDWTADYRATRPKVERKLAHLVRRGRRARRRGLERVDADWNLLAGAVNLARLATLGVHHTAGGWKTTPA